MPDKADEKKKPRELFEIDVREVSLVDRPANRQPFVVIKRETKETDMATFEADPRDELKVEKAKAAEDEEKEKAKAKDEDEMEKAKAKAKDEEEKEKAKAKAKDEEEKEKAKDDNEEKGVKKQMPAELKSALTEVVAWMKKMAGGPGAPKDAIGMVAPFLTKLAAGGYPSPEQKVETKKSEDVPAIQIMQDGSIQMSGQPVDVEKSRKRFTPQRVESFKGALVQLLQILNGVEPDAIKSLLSKAKGKDEDEEKRKADDEEEKDVKKTLSDLSERIEKIEDTRAPSKKGQGEGRTDKKVEKKDNFWGELL